VQQTVVDNTGLTYRPVSIPYRLLIPALKDAEKLQLK